MTSVSDETVKRSLADVRLHDVDQLLSGACFGRRRAPVRINHVVPDVALHHLRHQTAHGAPSRGDQQHNVRAVLLVFETALYGLDLSNDSLDASQQLLFVPNGMCHSSWRMNRHSTGTRHRLIVRHGRQRAERLPGTRTGRAPSTSHMGVSSISYPGRYMRAKKPCFDHRTRAT